MARSFYCILAGIALLAVGVLLELSVELMQTSRARPSAEKFRMYVVTLPLCAAGVAVVVVGCVLGSRRSRERSAE